mgnify:CR=1 FL=1
MYDNTIEVKPEVTMIWQILRRRKLATEEQLQEVLEESRNTGQDFEEVLYNYQIITEDQLLQLVADELNTQFVELHISSSAASDVYKRQSPGRTASSQSRRTGRP